MRKDSIWKADITVPEYSPLHGDAQTDVLVIGGGIVGVLTAYMLKKRNIRCILVEADRLFSGQTGATTAKITSQHGMIYDTLIRTMGIDTACRYAAANETAISVYRKMVEELSIDCDFRILPAYLYARGDTKSLQKETEAAKNAGLAAAFVKDCGLPFPVSGAVRFDGQAQFHPLKFLTALLPELTVYEKTRILSVKKNKARTATGTITAKSIVFATHFPFINMPGLFFMKMHQERSYVIALEHAEKLSGVYLGVDPGESLSLRNFGDSDTVLLGGGGHRTGENRPGGKYAMLRDAARHLWPQAAERFAWSAQDCMTLDHIPYIGRFSRTEPDLYVATGFGKWGMTSAMLSAMIIPDLIEEKENPYADTFSPLRAATGSSASAFMKEGVHAVKDLSRRVFSLPRGAASKLPAGHGGVVEVDGEKLGVYKEILPDGGEKLHIVSVKCPHLGCQLEWNPDEKSWDCPCHGSRFDPDGHLLDGPAETDLPAS